MSERKNEGEASVCLPLHSESSSKKFIYEKKRLESKLRRKYVLNLLKEPQHLAKIKKFKTS